MSDEREATVVLVSEGKDVLIGLVFHCASWEELGKLQAGVEKALDSGVGMGQLLARLFDEGVIYEKS